MAVMATSGLPGLAVSPSNCSTRRGHRRRGRPRPSSSAISLTVLLFVVVTCSAAATPATEAGFALPSSSATVKLPSVSTSRPTSAMRARGSRRRPDDEDDYDDDYLDDDGYLFGGDDRRGRTRGPSRRAKPPVDDLGGGGGNKGDEGLNLPSPFGRRRGLRLPESLGKSLLAAVFVLGIGTGVTVDSAINTDERDLASRDAIDRNAPNPNLCTSYGASAMAFDTRVFVTFDPFDVYVAQADVKPSCVLRPSNVVPVLRDSRKLISDDEIRSCKANMNTWAFVGDLDDVPQLSCVYKSEDAQNEFLSGDPRLGVGEDVWDDDRASGRLKGTTRKMVKDARTAAQNDEIKRKMKMSESE